MKLKIILPAVTTEPAATPSLGLGTLMSCLDAADEIVVTAEQAQQPAMWEDADVVVITVGPHRSRTLNLAELYRMAGIHVVLLGSNLGFVAETVKPHQTVFLGRADELWAAFLRDWRAGVPGRRYTSEFKFSEAEFCYDPVPAA